MAMNKYLFPAMLVLSAGPVQSFGDPAQAGAAAWCGARRNGASVEQADKQMRKTMASQMVMSTDFASALVGTLNNRQGM